MPTSISNVTVHFNTIWCIPFLYMFCIRENTQLWGLRDLEKATSWWHYSGRVVRKNTISELHKEQNLERNERILRKHIEFARMTDVLVMGIIFTLNFEVGLLYDTLTIGIPMMCVMSDVKSRIIVREGRWERMGEQRKNILDIDSDAALVLWGNALNTGQMFSQNTQTEEW